VFSNSFTFASISFEMLCEQVRLHENRVISEKSFSLQQELYFQRVLTPSRKKDEFKRIVE